MLEAINPLVDAIENYRMKILGKRDGATIVGDDMTKIYHEGQLDGIANMIDIIFKHYKPELFEKN